MLDRHIIANDADSLVPIKMELSSTSVVDSSIFSVVGVVLKPLGLRKNRTHRFARIVVRPGVFLFVVLIESGGRYIIGWA